MVCVSVTPIVKQCVNILMEGSPPNLDSDELCDEIKALAQDGDVIEIVDFHVWTIS